MEDKTNDELYTNSDNKDEIEEYLTEEDNEEAKDEQEDEDEEYDESDEDEEYDEEEETSIEELLERRLELLESLHEDPNNYEDLKNLTITDTLLCEEYIKIGNPSWKIPALCEEILYYNKVVTKSLPTYTYKDCPKEFEELKKGIVIYNTTLRASNTLYKHPRLKLRMLENAVSALRKMRMQDFPMWYKSLDEMAKEARTL